MTSRFVDPDPAPVGRHLETGVGESLRLDWGMNAPARARVWVRDMCAIHGLDDLVEDAVLMVGELVTNVVLHARTNCRLVAEFGDQTMRVDVMDEDHSMGTVRVGDGLTGGLGLRIVDALASSWGVLYGTEGKTVWFAFRADDAFARRHEGRSHRTGDQRRDAANVRRRSHLQIVPAPRISWE